MCDVVGARAFGEQAVVADAILNVRMFSSVIWCQSAL
jgi:hypothetical protein